MGKELEGPKEGSKEKIHRFTQNERSIKLEMPGHDGIHGFWFKKFTLSMKD